jgi:phytoene desaturase
MKTPHARTAMVVGAGISGLATANLLAHQGWEVTVLEQSDQLGGRAGWLVDGHFKFDAGPSWYLMPEVFEHYFGLLGRRPQDYFQLVRLDPAYRVFPEGHEPVTIHADLVRDAATFGALEPGAGAQLRAHVQRAGVLYRMAVNHFLYIDRVIPQSFIDTQVLRALPAIPKTLRLNRLIESHFKHPVLRQILQYHSVFLGVSPFKAPSLYALMSYLDFQQGVYYPAGGMYEIVRALERIGGELGVTYRLETPVEHIETTAGRATGVRLSSGQTLAADLVVAATDLHHAEQSLLSPEARSIPDRFWRSRAQPSPSALLLYLGVKGLLPQLSHHNLIFTNDWRSNFADIFTHGRWPKPASMYVSVPSRTDPTVAPPGHENVFVLIPLPAGIKQPSPREQATAADNYIAQLATAIGEPDLASRIVVRRSFGPDDFGARFNTWQSSGLGLGHTWGQSAWFRPGVASKKLANLYYVGADVRPGIGLPMCLISAQLVIKHLTGDRSAGPASTPLSDESAI